MRRLCPRCEAPIQAKDWAIHLQAHARQDSRDNGGSRNRNRQAQARFRVAVLARANGQCQAIDDGQRCQAVIDLQAHHLEPGNHDPTKGVALCRHHHRKVDKHAS